MHGPLWFRDLDVIAVNGTIPSVMHTLFDIILSDPSVMPWLAKASEERSRRILNLFQLS